MIFSAKTRIFYDLTSENWVFFDSCHSFVGNSQD
jgi:hypothetical protein